MKIFHCDHCRQLVFYENIRCVNCGHTLAYLPERAVIGSLEQASENLWRSPAGKEGGRMYRLCRNYNPANVCNWALVVDEPHALCRSCRLTRVIPDLSRPGHPEAWYRLEVAKRRLIYTLLDLSLPVVSKDVDPAQGLAFEFLADPTPRVAGAAPVLTGHKDGVITYYQRRGGGRRRTREAAPSDA
jgi:hypothetical protein